MTSPDLILVFKQRISQIEYRRVQADVTDAFGDKKVLILDGGIDIYQLALGGQYEAADPTNPIPVLDGQAVIDHLSKTDR